MFRQRKGLWAALALAAGCWLMAADLMAAPTPEQTGKIRAADAALRQAGVLFKGAKYQEAGEQVTQAQQLLADLAAAPNYKEFARSLEPMRTRLKNAHALLELEGITLPPLDTPGGAGGGGGGISFVKQVAPLLIAKCGRCHVNDNKGEFSMANFASLERGNADGVVIMPGKGSGSRIVEVIESGDMPRGGGTVSKEELALLTTWIDQGARYDGGEKNMALVTLVPTAKPMEEMKLEATKSTGRESVSFAKDIAPVLVAQCTGCHGGQQARANLNMQTFAGLLRGGESGAPLVPGKPADSLIVKKIKGLSGDRMPLQKPPLSDEVIAKFDKWIAEGATLDGPDPAQMLVELVAIVFAKGATHDELAQHRMTLADQTWRLAIPDDKPAMVETKNFLVMGNVSERVLEEVSQAAEVQAANVTKILRAPAGQTLIKGRITLFVLRARYDYTEFGTMVEKRSIPDNWQGHFRYDIVNAYGVVVPPKEGTLVSLPALLGQIVAGIYVADTKNAPSWFSEGAGRAMAARINPKDARVRQWDERVPSALSASGKPDAFIAGSLPPEDTDILSYSFVKFLMTNPAKFSSLLAALREGAPFDQGMVRAFGGTAPQLTVSWAPRAFRGK